VLPILATLSPRLLLLLLVLGVVLLVMWALLVIPPLLPAGTSVELPAECITPAAPCKAISKCLTPTHTTRLSPGVIPALWVLVLVLEVPSKPTTAPTAPPSTAPVGPLLVLRMLALRTPLLLLLVLVVLPPVGFVLLPACMLGCVLLPAFMLCTLPACKLAACMLVAAPRPVLPGEATTTATPGAATSAEPAASTAPEAPFALLVLVELFRVLVV
jgi:hypothetical protein